MRVSFSTGTFYHRGLDYSLTLAREVGYDGVELAIGPEYTLRGVGYLARALERASVAALSVHPPFKGLPGWPQGARVGIPHLAQVAERLGAELAVAHTPLLMSEGSPRGLAYSRGLQLGREASAGVALGLETNQYNRRAQRYVFDDLTRLTRYAQAHDCAITFDTCHAGANGEDLLACYAIVRPALRNIHLSDVVWRDGQPLTHVMVGEGTLPLASLLGALARDGYAGLVTVEVRPKEVGYWGRAEHVRRMRQALEFVRAAAQQPASARPLATS